MRRRRNFRKAELFYEQGLVGDTRMELVNETRKRLEQEFYNFMSGKIDSYIGDVEEELEDLPESEFDPDFDEMDDSIALRIVWDAIDEMKFEF